MKNLVEKNKWIIISLLKDLSNFKFDNWEFNIWDENLNIIIKITWTDYLKKEWTADRIFYVPYINIKDWNKSFELIYSKNKNYKWSSHKLDTIKNFWNFKDPSGIKEIINLLKVDVKSSNLNNFEINVYENKE